jgi:hypothetical protein
VFILYVHHGARQELSRSLPPHSCVVGYATIRLAG